MAGLVGKVFARISLGDQRLFERLGKLVERLSAKPEASLPEATGEWAETAAAYRFFNNASVKPEAIVEGLAQATVERCQGEPVILAVQDTTSLDYTDHPKTKGLGPLEAPERRGLFVHTTLAVTPRGVPLGVVAQAVWARDPDEVGKSQRRKELPVEAKESAKWLRALKRTEERLGGLGARVVSVADREADLYELFALAQELTGDWLIRARHDRRLGDAESRLVSVIEQAPVCLCTLVEVPAKPKAKAKPKQPARRAKLEVRRAEVELVPPARAKGVIARWWAEHPEVERLAPEQLGPVRVGVVLVSEVDPPAGVEPLRWLLLTSLPLDTPEEVLSVIAYYRLRWLIERYHFVLKSGCRVERLQLETAERLERALSVYAAVAWKLLWLTYEARAQPEAPCTVALEDDEWRLLWVLSCPKVSLPLEPPNLATAVRQIAKLGGFLGRKGDGQPGVKVLWRGLRRLDDMVATYRALREHPDLLTTQPTADLANIMYVQT